jgi:hypothetical protein
MYGVWAILRREALLDFSLSREMIDQVNAATGDMNAAAKALNGG